MDKKFTIAPDGVDPKKVPQRTLYTGAKMPAVGLGTFGSDRFTAEQIAEAVFHAIELGYRAIDCAACYYNEKEVGASINAAIAGGLGREELFITSKVWNNMHGYDNVIKACKASLSDLGLDYLDLYLVHWPFPNYHPPGADPDFHSPDSKPYIHEDYMDTWRAMEKLYEMGLVKNIGTSNMTVAKMKLLLRDCKIRPAANEMELHPCFQQQEFFDFCLSEKIQPIGFCPIGSPTRPDRDKTPEDFIDTQEQIVVDIAKKHGVHPAVICVKWAVQRGQIPIPFSVYRNEYLSNLKCTTEDPLTDEEMAALKTVERGSRLIKGQVFLWRDGLTWKDLWDEDGVIVQ